MTGTRDLILWISILGLFAAILLVVHPATGPEGAALPVLAGRLAAQQAPNEALLPVIVSPPEVPMPAPTSVGIAPPPVVAMLPENPAAAVFADLEAAWHRRPVAAIATDYRAPVQRLLLKTS